MTIEITPETLEWIKIIGGIILTFIVGCGCAIWAVCKINLPPFF